MTAPLIAPRHSPARPARRPGARQAAPARRLPVAAAPEVAGGPG